MTTYTKITPELVSAMEQIVGKKNVSTQAEVLEQYKTDEETNPSHFVLPEAVVKPANAKEIASFGAPGLTQSDGASPGNPALGVSGAHAEEGETSRADACRVYQLSAHRGEAAAAAAAPMSSAYDPIDMVV